MPVYSHCAIFRYSWPILSKITSCSFHVYTVLHYDHSTVATSVIPSPSKSPIPEDEVPIRDQGASSFSSSVQEALFLLIIGASQLFSIGALGNTAFSVEQNDHTLGTTQNAQLSWFLSSYALGGGIFVLVTGRLGDRFGHKYVFMAGWIWMA